MENDRIQQSEKTFKATKEQRVKALIKIANYLRAQKEVNENKDHSADKEKTQPFRNERFFYA